jgi:CRP-like cAMP-binding protein
MQSISIRQTSTKYTHSPRDSLPSQSTTTDQVNSHKRLIDLLEQSSPNNRDHETTRDISDQLLQLQFFQHIPRSDVENLAQQVQYRHMREHQTILRENDDGKAFYVIFHGRACVFKLDRPILTASDDNAEDNNTGDNGEEKTTSDTEQDMDRVSATTPTATKGVGSKWLRENNKRAAKEDELQLQHNHGGFITALTKDDTFGEVSLVKSLHQKGSRKRMKKHHKLRTATVVATSMAGCDVIVIHYEDFRKFVSPHGTGAEFYAWKRCRDILHVPKQARSAVEIGLLCNFVVTSKITFFAQLSGPLRRKVCQCAVLRTMNANETIFSEGKEGKEFFIILNGEVIVVKKNDDDASTEKVVARLCKGDAFGEQALLSGQPRTATTKAYENGPIELMVISEQDYHTVLEPLMSWSKNRFAQSTLLATNVSTSLKILNIPPSKRNATHIAQLRFFLDQLPFFKQLPGKLVDRMCHVVSLRKGDRHDCMCHQGDRGDEFFVILKGSVSVHIIKDEDKKNIVTARRRWQQNQQKHNIGGGGAGRSFGRSFVAGDAGDAGEAGGNQQKRAKHNAKHNANPNNTTNNTDNNKFQELVDEFDRKRESTPTSAKTKKKQWEKESRKRRGNGAESSDNEERGGDHIDDLLEDHGEAVATLLSGDSFGEMSLVSNHPRFATVICREKSMFMIISKEDYLAIASIGLVFDPSQCRDLLNKIPIKRTPSEIERMVQFVKPIPFFSQLDRNVCRKLCVCMTKIKAKQRNVVVLQGDEVDNHGGCFYILLKGSVSIHVAEHRVAPDPTGLKILMDRRPKDGHAHKEGYFSHVDHQGQHQGQHGGHVGTVSPQKAGYAATGHQVHELHRDAHQQMLAPLALETPIPLHRINEVDRVLGKCVTLLRAGDSFGELGLHDHHDHDGLSHENDKTALHIMQAGKEDTAATTTHSSHHRRHTTNSPHVGSSMGGSMGGGSPVKLTKQEKTLLLEQQMVGRRNASIVCREDCELLIVRRKDFLDVLSQQQIHFNPALARDIMNKSINNRSASDLSVLVQLCESLSFFSQFPTHLIQKCCKCLVLENYDPGDVIFEQGAKGDAFYIVLRGYLELDISSGCTLDESSSSDHHEPMSVAHAERVSMEMENEEILFRRHLSSKGK